jgi:hypothetical protein
MWPNTRPGFTASEEVLDPAPGAEMETGEDAGIIARIGADLFHA